MIKEGEYKEIAPGKHFILINNYSKTEAEKLVRDWMRKGILKAGDLAEKSEIIEMELKFVPIWLVNVNAETSYRGKKKFTSVRKNGKRTVRTVRWENKSGQLSDVVDWKVLASRGMRLPLGKLNLAVANKTPFNIKNIPPGAKLINGDVDEELAKKRAETGIRKLHRRRASFEVDELLSIHTEVHVGETQLLTVPLWFLRYKYKRKIYQLIFDGSSGEVIEGEAPMGKYDILLIVGIVVSIIIAILLAITFWPR